MYIINFKPDIYNIFNISVSDSLLYLNSFNLNYMNSE